MIEQYNSMTGPLQPAELNLKIDEDQELDQLIINNQEIESDHASAGLSMDDEIYDLNSTNEIKTKVQKN